MKKQLLLFVLASMTAGYLWADFHEWAVTPPMGWNSWDCYGAAVNEAEFRANVDVLAERLKPFGYEYAVCDIRWTVQNEGLTGYNQENPVYTLDECGRYLPAPSRFPSAAKGAGFKSHANMWRVVNDVWDSWGHIEHLVPIMCKWLERDSVQGSWPDCDMIPFGKLGLKGHYWSVDAKAKGRTCNLTADEQKTLMNFFAITRSPLMLGADLPQLDDATFALITGKAILAAQRDGRNPKPLFCTKDACAIASESTKDGKFLALFRTARQGASPTRVRKSRSSSKEVVS